MSNINTMTDEELIAIIRATDMTAKPIDQRFEGDDTSIVELMNEMGLKQTIVDKLLINGLVLREAVNRGLQISNPN